MINHIADATKMVRLAPLPSFTFGSHTHALNFIAASLTDLGGEQQALDAVCAHITHLTRRLAEVEAMQAHDAECAATAIRERIAAETRVAELTNSAALNDEMLRHELAEEQFARQQAEARVVELEREVREMGSACSTLLSSVCAERDAAQAVADRRGKKIQRTAENLCATRKKLSKVEAEREAHRATVARIVEWARGRCECCSGYRADVDDCIGDDGSGVCTNWTPAWEVK